MTEQRKAFWIRDNLGKYIRQALEDYRKVNPTHFYTEDWLAGIAFREVHNLIERYADQKLKFEVICSLMKGDYGQRKGDKEKCYHGFSFWQIDIGSFPEWIKTGSWKDPYKSCYKAIMVLDNKRKYLQVKFPNLKGELLHKAVTSAYNSGEGNVRKALQAGLDTDHYTHNRDYAKEVFRYREIYRNLPAPQTK
jgi:hypothetical protein